MSIKSINSTNEGLEIFWSDGNVSCFPWFWLRDHSESTVDLHPDTKQRQIDSFSTPLDNTVNKVWLDENGHNLYVKWEDQSESCLSYGLLECMAIPTPPQSNVLQSSDLWNSPSEIKNFPKMTYKEFLGNNGIKTWLENIQRVGFVLVTGSPTTAEATKELMERIAYIRSSIFGEFSVWDNKLENPDDTAYTSLAIEPHTDGTYLHDAPGLQTLHCIRRDAEGGNNKLIDGLAIAETMRVKHPAAFEILCNIKIPGRYIKPDTYLQAHRPVFRVNDDGGVIQVSFNNHDRAPFRLENNEMVSFYEAYGIFHNLANQANRQFEFCLEPGTVITFDNWRLLHARSALTGYRQLCGGYHNREDFESRLRGI